MKEINTSPELFSELRDANQRVTKWFTEIPAEEFFTRHGEIWSASNNMDHLIKSHKPITKALKLAKLPCRPCSGNLKDNQELMRKFAGCIGQKLPKARRRRGVFSRRNKALSKPPMRKKLNCWSSGQKSAQNLYWLPRNGMIVNWMDIYFRIH